MVKERLDWPICVEGYEPKTYPIKRRAMERAQSVPTRGSAAGTMDCNPFYSEKVKSEINLQAARPLDLPRGSSGGFGMEPIQSSPGVDSQPQGITGPTGKGRGGHSAGLLDALQPTESGLGSLQTEGELPVEDGLRTMDPVGPVRSTKQSTGKTADGDLQRALEGELVEFLRCQNSKLLAEVASLRDKLEKTSGTGSSPWSAVDGVESVEASQQHGRHGRHGSRTPRVRTREVAVSPERKVIRQTDLRYTPNGTRVPDGPPPDEAAEKPLPPVPPFPDDVRNAGEPQQSSFVSGCNDGLDIYDTCDSKPKMKNGDAA